MSTYKIIRMFSDIDSRDHIDNRDRVVKTGLTLEEAQEHCSDPETSSSTCTGREGMKRTEKCGMWFDGYEEEAS